MQKLLCYACSLAFKMMTFVTIQSVRVDFNPWGNICLQNVPRLRLFFNNSRWCKWTTLPVFLFVLWSALDIKL